MGYFVFFQFRMVRRRQASHFQAFQQTVKDYFVPLAGWIIILLLIYNFMSKGNDAITNGGDNENQTPTDIVFESVDTEAYIEYPGDVREKITDATNLYKGETIIVKEGNVELIAPDATNINLNKIAELKIENDGSYSLFSSDAWFNLASDTNIAMRYANIQSPTNSVISLTQNEAGSTIYVLKGTAKVSNLGWVSTMLTKWQKVSVSRLNATKEDIDLAGEKKSIDSYFKWSDWFIANNGPKILAEEDSQDTQENTEDFTSSGALVGAKNQYIAFATLSDEMSVSVSSMNIAWEILDDTVSAVTIQNQPTVIDTTDKTFGINDVSLPSSTNDIVIKIYDGNNNILLKEVYTVYTSTPAETVTSDTSTASTEVETPTGWHVNNQGTTTYDVDGNDFWFTAPSVTGKYTTTSPEVTIRGVTSAEWITTVEVNGFELSSFNGSTWRYHAFERFNTLEEGTNQYKINYYGADGNIIYSDYYTIIKEPAGYVAPVDTSDTSEETVSDEATL